VVVVNAKGTLRVTNVTNVLKAIPTWQKAILRDVKRIEFECFLKLKIKEKLFPN
jgi:hypothetical protein